MHDETLDSITQPEERKAGGCWISVGESITGPVRQNNEDRIYTDDLLGLWCVADGMGGHLEGGVASSLITQSLEDLQAEEIGSIDVFINKLIDLLKNTNQIIYSISNEMFESKQIIGSTFVILVLYRDRGYVLWAGDSRLYRMRDVYFEQVTVDHTQYEVLKSQHLLDEQATENAQSHPANHILTRAMGVREELEFEMLEIDVQDKDVFLLCSDGLYNVMDQIELGKSLYYADDYTSALKALINAAVLRGSTDNVSAVIVGNTDV